MIVVGIGANLAASRFATQRATCEAAVDRLDAEPDIRIVARSRWYESEPVPTSDQPWYVNGVMLVATDLTPEELLARLHAIEASFGRVRRVRNEARPLDLDLIDYAGQVRDGTAPPALPHPRAERRAFVLLPLRDVAPAWRHPVSGRSVSDLIAALPPGDGQIRVLA